MPINRYFHAFPIAQISLIVFLFIAGSSSTWADGMVMKIDPYSDRFDYADETNQNAIISYEEGYQSMILNIGIDESDRSDMVWIFPLPSDPRDIVLDVFREFPSLHGEELSGKAKSNLADLQYALHATQLYPAIFPGGGGMNGGYAYEDMDSMAVKPETKAEGDVEVYEHVDKEGVTSEIITARTADGIERYLSSKGLNIDTLTVPALDYYIGRNYSFVVSWISEGRDYYRYSERYREYPEYDYPERYQNYREDDYAEQIPYYPERGGHRGVFVTFPTDEIFFPLLPTSVYGSQSVPATITVLGHVTPNLYRNIERYTDTEYFVDGRYNYSIGLEKFFENRRYPIAFTKISINAPSKYFTDDLWIKNRAPIKTYFASFVANRPIVLGVILLIIGSALTGIFAGWFVFRKLRFRVKSFIWLGLANCFSILGLMIATFSWKTGNLSDEAKNIEEEIRKLGYAKKRTWALILFVYSFLSVFMGFLLQPLGYGWYLDSIAAVFIFFILPTAAFMVALDKIKVHREDEHLFKELRSIHRANSLTATDWGEKMIFIPVYSVSFLAISWLMIKLLEIGV